MGTILDDDEPKPLGTILDDESSAPTLDAVVSEGQSAPAFFEGPGYKDLRTLPGQLVDIWKGDYKDAQGDVTPTSVARGVLRKQFPGTAFALDEAGADVHAIGKIADVPEVEDAGKTLLEASKGRRVLSEAELQVLADTDPGAARRARRMKTPMVFDGAGGSLSFGSIADEATEWKHGAGELVTAIPKAIVDLAGDVKAGRYSEVLRKPADLTAYMAAENIKSIARTANAGGIRREEPLSSLFDVASLAGIGGGGAAGLKALQEGKGVMAAKAAFGAGSAEAAAAVTKPFKDAVRSTPLGSLLYSKKAVIPSLPGDALQAPKPMDVDALIEDAKAAGAAKEAAHAKDVVKPIADLAAGGRADAFVLARQAEPLAEHKYAILAAARRDRKVGLSLAKDIEDDELLELGKSGAVLALDDKPMNTTLAAVEGRGLDQDLLQALAQKRLKFVDVPGGRAVPDATKDAALMFIATKAEQAKEAHAVGLLGRDALAAQLTSYVQGIFERGARQKGAPFNKGRPGPVSAAMPDGDFMGNELKVMTHNGQRVVYMPQVGLPGTKVPVWGALDGKPVPVEVAHALLKARRTLRPSVATGAKGGWFERAGFLRKAEVKYATSLEEQAARGRMRPDRFDEVASIDLAGHNALIHEHRLYQDVANGLAFDKLPAAAVRGQRTMLRKLFGREEVEMATLDGERWAQVPTTKLEAFGSEVPEMGALAGRWVPIAALERLEQATRYQTGWYGKMRSAWKQNKIINNLASHLGQASDNMVRTILDNGSPVDLAQSAAQVHGALAGKPNRIFDRFGELGLYKPLPRASTLGDLRHPVDAIRRAGGDLSDAFMSTWQANGLARATGQAAVSAYKGMSDVIANAGMAKMWAAQELVSKYAAFNRFLRRASKATGRPLLDLVDDPAVAKKAAEHASRFALETDDLPKWAELARNLPVFGQPFVAFTVKGTRYYGALAWTKPLYMRSLLILDHAGYDLATPAEQKRRDMAPGYRQGSTVPIGDQDLNVHYLSQTTLAPFSEGQSGAGNVASVGKLSAVQNAVTPTGPLVGLYDVARNKTGFYDRPVVKDSDPTGEKWRKRLKVILDAAGPGTLGAVVRKVLPALRGEEDNRGRQLSLAQALAGVMGLRLENPDVEAQADAAEAKAELAYKGVDEWWAQLSDEEQASPRAQEVRRRREERVAEGLAYDLGRKLK